MRKLSIFFVIVATLVYQLGLLEKPPFVYKEDLLGGHELYAFVATTRERLIGQHILRLIDGSKKGVAETDNGPILMEAAAKLYGSPEGAAALSVGLYFDDPNEVETPRWAVGWAVEGSTYEDLQKMVPSIQEKSGLPEPVRLVRIGGNKGTHIFTARIPWRNMLTPMIAPILHWKRGFQLCQDYIKENNLSQDVKPIALEVYVTGKDNKRHYIDYIILFGDVGKTWEDTFPGTDFRRFEEFPKEPAPKNAKGENPNHLGKGADAGEATAMN